MSQLTWHLQSGGQDRNTAYLTGQLQLEKIILIQPSSAAAERVFSLLKVSFNERQDGALQDYIEASLMLQYNKCD